MNPFGRRKPVWMALALGLLAGGAAYLSIKAQEREVRKGWALVPALVVVLDVKAGTTLTREMVQERPVPEQFVTSSVVKPSSIKYVLNQRVSVALQAGDPLLWSHFETGRVTDRLSSKVQRKARAFTLDASKTTSVGGWIRPNDHVDVIGTFRDPQSHDAVSVTLLENVIVLATGKLTGTSSLRPEEEGARDYSNVTLLVVPEEAEILALATDLGKLTLSLRNDEDLDVLDERGRADVHTLMSGQRTKALQERRMRTIQIIQGTRGERSAVLPSEFR